VSENRLGKGIEALIRPKLDKKENISPQRNNSKTNISKISISKILPNPYQPRQDFSEDSIIELQSSIKEKGIITPVAVRKTDLGYELIAGERRLRAAKKLRMRSIPAYVIKVKNNSEMMEIALIENVQRKNLNPIEISEALMILNSKFGLSHKKISESIGKSRVSVTNSLRLLKLPDKIIESLRSGEITSGHGRAILQLDTEKAQIKMWKKIIQDSLSVRNAEFLVKPLQKKKKKIFQKKIKNISYEVSLIENQLIEKFGTKVKVRNNSKGGVIEISYFSNDDLDRLLEIFESLSN
tara:strand:+ start:3920 stop:4807 length:888 start_codon:yes stop_codon:yes gene_type:complete